MDLITSLPSRQTLDLVRIFVDVVIVTFLVYQALLFIRGTRAAPMLSALTFVVVLYFVSRPFGLTTLSWLLNNFLSSIILVAVVIFQDEIRRGLTKLGSGTFFRRGQARVLDQTLEDVATVAIKLSESKLGALIVFQKEVGLDELVEDAISLDALVNRKLLFSIFLKDSPLHDGAVVIDGDRLRAAGCVLPLSFNPDLDPNLGTRHRAGLGITERTDAVVLVVSEENGAISIIKEGELIRNLDEATLRENLFRFMGSDRITADNDNDLNKGNGEESRT